MKEHNNTKHKMQSDEDDNSSNASSGPYKERKKKTPKKDYQRWSKKSAEAQVIEAAFQDGTLDPYEYTPGLVVEKLPKLKLHRFNPSSLRSYLLEITNKQKLKKCKEVRNRPPSDRGINDNEPAPAASASSNPSSNHTSNMSNIKKSGASKSFNRGT